MGIVSAQDRIARYEASLDGERVPANILAIKSLMIEKFSAYVNIIVPKEIATKAICDDELVKLKDYPWYQAAMRDLYKAKFNGGSVEQTIILNKWIARGLQSDILDRILTEVVNI